MRYLLLFVFMFAAIGCTKNNLCDAGKTAAGLVATQISAQLDCKNVDAVRADIEKQLVEIKICEKKDEVKSLIVGDMVCKPVIEALVLGALSKVPPGWECKGGEITEDIKLKLVTACSKAF